MRFPLGTYGSEKNAFRPTSGVTVVDIGHEQVGAIITDQFLYKGISPSVRRTKKGCQSHGIYRVYVSAQAYAYIDGFKKMRHIHGVSLVNYPAHPGRCHQWCGACKRCYIGVGPMIKEQLHDFGITGKSGS